MKKIELVNNRRNRRLVSRKSKSKRKQHVTYVLMATVLPVHVVTGTIDFPGSISGRKERAHLIVDTCASSKLVAIDPAVIKKVNDDIDNYTNALPGNRPGMFKTMNQAIQNSLLSPFQEAANADPINSIVILESGGFKVKLQVIRTKQVFEVVAAEKPGIVVLKAPGGPKEVHLHNWFSSTDGISYKQEQSTNAAFVQLGGFPSNKLAYFITQLSIKDVLQKMSGVIKIMVN